MGRAPPLLVSLARVTPARKGSAPRSRWSLQGGGHGCGRVRNPHYFSTRQAPPAGVFLRRAASAKLCVPINANGRCMSLLLLNYLRRRVFACSPRQTRDLTWGGRRARCRVVWLRRDWHSCPCLTPPVPYSAGRGEPGFRAGGERTCPPSLAVRGTLATAGSVPGPHVAGVAGEPTGSVVPSLCITHRRYRHGVDPRDCFSRSA